MRCRGPGLLGRELAEVTSDQDGFDVERDARRLRLVVGRYVDVQTLSIAIPQQLGFDRGCGGGVTQPVRQAGALGVALVDVRVHLQAVVYLVDPLDAERDLFGQVPVDAVFHGAGEHSGGAFDLNLDAKGVEVAVQRKGRGNGAFHARLGDGRGRWFLRQYGQGGKRQHAGGRHNKGQSVEPVHRVSPVVSGLL